jgi:Amt family ammonium transporter
VLNTNLATAGALLTWFVMDIVGGPKKANFLGSVNGMIVGLVAITPAAGFVDGYGALAIGVLSSGIVWFSWNKMAGRGIFARVDDALGVVHTHGVAGLCGGILVGFFADPKMAEYYAVGPHGKLTPVSSAGLFYGHPGQVLIQAGAALTIIAWDGLVTVVLLKFIEKALRVPLRLTDRELEIGDAAIHLEEVLGPEDVLGLGAMAGLDNGPRERDRRELVGEGSPT